ncbi:MAG TPA: hypothetical protein VK983_05420, partial [Candidatus Limnocylindrales bacterium]|nr:hypothetical protein [Candidatus Limnocylindrales bacterium]
MFNRNQNQLPGGPAQRVRGGTELPACISDQIAQIQPEEIAARKLMRDVKELLAANGQPTTINDKPAVATSYFYPEVVGGNEYYVRALERPDLAGNPLHGLVFDDTEDLKINTVDPDLIHFQEDPITGSITVGSGTRLGRDTDEQGLLNYSQTVVTALQTAVEAGKRTQAKELALR